MKQKIYELELSLLDPSTRRSITHLNQLIADDFVEFGSSGKIYNKQDTLDSLPFEKKQVSISIEDFKVIELSNDVVLATYKVAVNSALSSRSSLRSSIWRRNGNDWQMFFHQGTKCGRET